MKAICNCVFITIFLLTNVIDQTNAAWEGYVYDSLTDRRIPLGGHGGPREDPFANGPVYSTYYDPSTGQYGRMLISPPGEEGQAHA
ncbi:unnamed protein product [Rodentolepis nana]|uniref:Secreted protein n=1 Tax=Rodentolepis nana TaxID=102285 RepID=A0A0R3THL7_RODNA|nr:unnamed protein product [Rodentolepis nana]